MSGYMDNRYPDFAATERLQELVYGPRPPENEGESVESEVEVGSFGGMSGYVLLPGDCEWGPGTPVRITLIGPPESEGENDA